MPARSRARILALALVLLAVTAACRDGARNPPASEPIGARISLSGTWKFAADPGDVGRAAGWMAIALDDSAWTDLAVPGEWNTLFRQGPFPESDGEFAGPAWYRTRFTVPEGFRRGHERLFFGAVNYDAEVYLNGTPLGRHVGDFVPFEFDVSDRLLVGRENVLAVRVVSLTAASVNTVPPANGRYDFWNHHGIHRDVTLESTAPTYVHDVYVRAEPGADGGPAPVTIDATVLNATAVETVAALRFAIADSDGNAVAAGTTPPFALPSRAYFTVRTGAGIPGARPWSPDAPHLYTLTVSLVGPEAASDAPLAFVESVPLAADGVLAPHATMSRPDAASADAASADAASADAIDEAAVTFGVRRIEASGGEIRLNGERFEFRGVNRHSEVPGFGRAVPAWANQRDVAMMKRIGINALRTAHYPNDPAIYDLADREGLAVYEEIPAAALRFAEMRNADVRALCLADARAMVVRDRNHPSILVWGAANEPTPWALSSFTSALYAETRRLDPTRLVGYARSMADLVARDPDADVVFLNPYYGWYAGTVETLSPFLDLARRRFPDKPIVLTEFGADAVPGYRDASVAPADAPHFTEDYQAFHLARTWAIARSKGFVSGGFVWVWADFLSPKRKYLYSGRIRADDRVLNPVPFHNLKGLVTADRVPKNAYLVAMGMYGTTPTGDLRVAVVGEDGAFVPNATVDAYLEDGAWVGHEVTGADGRAIWWYVPALPYRVRATAGDRTGDGDAGVGGETRIVVARAR
jgi:beta-galactosidase/beta-glucuronidase